MLVCSVSLRAPRRAIAAEIAEAAEAVDATTTGFVVFATLVDDPANVRDTVDAYIGEIMVEAASAADTVNAGLVYAAAINEDLTAAATQDGAVPAVYTGDIAEAAIASSAEDATTSAAALLTRILSSPIGGAGSAVVADDGSGKTRVIVHIGAVN